MTIKRDINKLIPRNARGKKRLLPLTGNRTIAASRGIGKLSGTTNIRTELRKLYSVDGIFTIEYYHVLGVQ